MESFRLLCTKEDYYNACSHNVRIRLIYLSPNMCVFTLGYKLEGVAFYANTIQLSQLRYVNV